MKTDIKTQKRNARRRRVRAKVFGTETRPRLAIHRSNTQLRAQIINDEVGKTLCAVTSASQSGKIARERIESAAKALAEQAKAKNISAVVFDRGGFSYGGNIKVFAEVARGAGLDF